MTSTGNPADTTRSVAMSSAEPPQHANYTPAGGSVAAKPQAWGERASAAEPRMTRRQALSCLATWTGAAVVWTVAGGVPRALGATGNGTPAAAGKGDLAFVQISDTHIGFRKDANPDVVGSL